MVVCLNISGFIQTGGSSYSFDIKPVDWVTYKNWILDGGRLAIVGDSVAGWPNGDINSFLAFLGVSLRVVIGSEVNECVPFTVCAAVPTNIPLTFACGTLGYNKAAAISGGTPVFVSESTSTPIASVEALGQGWVMVVGNYLPFGAASFGSIGTACPIMTNYYGVPNIL
jgi:hypothetical protein